MMAGMALAHPSPLDAAAAYDALKSRDARFDGRVFVGVTSTAIYCRPVCRVRTPRFENCRFFASAAQAEAAAFRPCLKCRPEIAPGLSAMDSSDALAHHAAQAIERAVQAGEAVALPALAARLGVTDRHLRRIFQAAHGVAPRDYLATQRLLLAKQLLTDTALPVAEVALASGFASVRRFNAAFAERYRLQPGALRRGASGSPPARTAGAAVMGAADGAASAVDAAAPAAVLRLAYRPPCDAAALLGFLQRRTVLGLEEIDLPALAWRRTLALPHRGAVLSGWVALRFDTGRHEVAVQVAPALAPALGALLQRLRAAFDLDADPARVDPVLALLPLPPRPGLRLPGHVDGFEVAVRVVLGQQVTVKAARTLVQRLVDRFGMPLATPFARLTRLFPDAATLAAADPAALGTLGIVRQRVGALQALAAAVAEGRIALHRGAPLAPTMQALQALPGIGPWTAEVIAMRALAWPDAWPASDIGLMNALGTRDPRRVQALAEPWRPWRAYAVMRLWHYVETGE
jgi:AraC family transcriptional regulator of adaptative response / DNA-3-methyladenine glycosylase II